MVPGWCQELPGGTRSCQELPGPAKSGHERPRAVRSGQERPGQQPQQHPDSISQHPSRSWCDGWMWLWRMVLA